MKSFGLKIGLFFAIIGSLIRIKSAVAQVLELSFTFDDTNFGYYVTLPGNEINWEDAETSCINNWEGHLATIKSAEEDSLLFYSSTDLNTYFSCWIGLNDIEIEASTDASAFVWVDGSTSTYRNFDSLGQSYPVATANWNCVRNRYRAGGVLSNGWINPPCTQTRSCYFCNKPGNSQGCDLIYDGSCYRVFEVSDGINWLDAQSSCAVWGGDLTSITTERENNYLYTIIPDTVSNCWIGLNDRIVEGTYTWTDESVYSHSNWTGMAPAGNAEDCFEIETAGTGRWLNVNCDSTRLTFLCKRLSTITTVARFGELINGGLDFETLSGNTFFYNSRTLACGGEENNAIVWKYSENSDLSNNEVLTATYSSTETGLSWLAADNTKQGYYRCETNSLSYTIGIYDTSLTTVAVSGTSYTYIEGIDREDVLLLCDSTNSGILSTLRWSLSGGMDFLNPININNKRDNLPDQSTSFNCVRGSSTFSSNFISVKVPELTIQIGSIIAGSFTSICPVMNEITIPLSTEDISLSINIVGKWNVLGTTYPTGSTTTITNFMQEYAGLYKFNINNWDGDDVCAIQIMITSSPAITAIREITTADSTFGYFTNSPNINWITAQLNCINWGGNLATIKSEEEDSLLFYSMADIDTYYSCWIGLNDIEMEAGTDASAFVWVDGSTSTYRNFGTLEQSYPVATANWNCVRNRYRSGGVLSNGWNNPPCNQIRNCYFCNKPGNSQGCDLIYDGFCYRVFEVSNGINWLDAQSSCAIWGGNLTSITTERENNYLYTILMDNSWIGLNDRDVDGTYTWIDGSVYSHTNWTSNAVSDEDCVEIIRAGEGSWGTVGCGMTKETFICKRASTSSLTTAGIIGELKNEGIDFQILNPNTFLYNSITLVCGGINNGVLWRFYENSDFTNSEELIATYSNTETGLSWLTISISKQGYYQCQLSASLSHTIGLYDLSVTTVAVSGITYNYTVGVDRQDVLLLCDPMGSVSLSLLAWYVEGSATLPNPINIYNMIDDLVTEYYSIKCPRDGDDISTNTIHSRVPQIIVQYGDIITKVSAVYPALNNLEIPIGIKDISISNNIEGRWLLPDGNYLLSTLTIPTFTSQNTGVYKLYITNWDGQEVCAIQINIDSITDDTEEITNFNIPIQVNYTVGSINALLYYSNTEIPDNKIRWTTDTAKDGDTKMYSVEYPNPVQLSTVFADVGVGVFKMSSFYRMSPVTLLGSLQLAIKDTVEVTIRYDGYSFTTSDISNDLFPSPQEIEIPAGTKNIQFTCSISECIWKAPLGNETSSPYKITVLSEENEGTYSLLRITSNGLEYATAQVNVTQAELGSSTSLAIVAIPIILIVILTCLILITILLIFCIYKRGKGKRSKFPTQRLNNEPGASPFKPQNVRNGSADTLEYPKGNLSHEYSIMEEKGTLETNFIQSEISSKPEENVYEQPGLDLAYEDVTEVLDPRMAPILLDVFKQHMDNIWKKEGALLEEYESFGGKTHRYTCKHATIEENKVKNRFKLIYPYDKSRVTLIPKSGNVNTDYINASKIPGFYVKESFIASQGPKENTLQDFWQMIIENDIVNIVMVTNLVESGRRKCEAYFPLKISKKVIIGPYEIILDNEEVKTGYTIRMMSVHSMGKTTKLKHFHFTAWPDHDVPTLYDELLLFVSKVQQGMIKTKAPVLVHCSAGVGRTGTFITLYNLFVAINQTKPISIYSIVHQMREHRPQMVQTFAQYKFIYLSVLEILLGSTSIPAREFVDTLNLYMQSEQTGYVSVFFQQYSELNYQCEKAFDPVCVDAIQESNSSKNPIKDILPSDNNRVNLCSPYWQGDYINASSLDNGEIILTIHPLAETLRDFHQLIYQMEPSLVIMLCSKKELQMIEQSKSQRVVYWPKYGESFQTESFKLTCEDSEKLHYIRNKITLQHMEEQSNKTFTQIISNNWNDKGEPDLKKNVLVLQEMLEFRHQFPSAPIIIHCQDGAGMSGVLYTVYKAIKNSTEKGFIDFFHIVKKLRNERMNSVTTLNHFLACYTLMNEYCLKVQ